MSLDLETADAHHDQANALYRAYLIARCRDAGSVANLAAKCKMPAKVLHNALDETCAYVKRRNVAHEIGCKLDKLGDLL